MISRTVRGLIVVGLALIVLVSLEVFSRFLLEGSATDGPRQMVQVSIPEGASIDTVAQILRENGLIEHPLLFRYAVRIMGADKRIQAGSMMLANGQSLFQLIRNLTRVKALGLPVTIREGLTSMQIAELLEEKVGIDSAAFMAAVMDSALADSLELGEAPSLEGYLFPDTYFIARDSNPRRVATRMVANLKTHLPESTEDDAARLGLTLNEVMSLASIIEWETRTWREAPVISSVYHNRLKRGMPLQADPTVSYALGKGPSRLYYSDLQVDSPYNTYKYPGLPPGPINNPGMRAVEAALNPDSTPYLFFVSRGDGTHSFTTNLGDHLSAKQHLDRLRREHSADSEKSSAGDTTRNG